MIPQEIHRPPRNREIPPGGQRWRPTTDANKKVLTRAETEDGESFVLDPEEREGRWRTGRPLPEAVVALRDFQPPHRKRIAYMRARTHRDKAGRQALAKRKGSRG